jgi:tetratricopeptide (TPR) repeat protein
VTGDDQQFKLKVSAPFASSTATDSRVKQTKGVIDRSLSWYARREPRVIVVLASVATLAFFGVSGLSKVYHRELGARGSRWFASGDLALRSKNLTSAVRDFQVALSFSRDNFEYELKLAQALVALSRTEEALAYLDNLWQREPENGSVNLELARIYSNKKDITKALRYYHNAIYAVWSGDADARQLSVRLELIRFLLEQKAQYQAEAELISLGKNLPDDPSLRLHVANLYMKVPAYQRAFAEYKQVLKLDRHNTDALAGAGRAAFEMGDYRVAQRYLGSVVASKPNDVEDQELLKLAKMVPKTDPYQIYSPAERRRAALNAFNTAGQRLNTCLNQGGNVSSSVNPNLQALYAQWTEMKTRLTERTLRQHSNWLDPAMDLVFSIERQTSENCGPPSGDDRVLLLISKLHEGAQ